MLQYKLVVRCGLRCDRPPSPPQDNSGWKSGELIFDKYSNEDEINYGSVEGCGDNCILNLRQLEEARAEYSVTLQLPSTAPLGKYTIKVESKIMGDTTTSGHKFRAIATSTDAFTVAECVVTSEAENYETRFMSNQSFMTL